MRKSWRIAGNGSVIGIPIGWGLQAALPEIPAKSNLSPCVKAVILGEHNLHAAARQGRGAVHNPDSSGSMHRLKAYATSIFHQNPYAP